MMLPIRSGSAHPKRSWHTPFMRAAVIDAPILNSPFVEPSRQWGLDERPCARPRSGRIAVKVINHYGDEAMRVFRI